MGRGTLIVVEGIDGAGKSVVLDACGEWLRREGLHVLDLRQSLADHPYPELGMLIAHDAVLCEEPTKSPLGRRVREMMKLDVPPDTLAQAFDADRSELLIRAVLPALDEGKIVVSERSVLSSLVYQGCQGMGWNAILAMPGNRLALERPPDIVIIADVGLKSAAKRLKARAKKDDAVFELTAFLGMVKNAYLKERFRTFVESLGARLVMLDTSGTAAGTRWRVFSLLDTILAERRGKAR